MRVLLQSRRRRQPSRSPPQSPPPRNRRLLEPPTTFAARVRVTHRTFGTGVVKSVDGDKLEIKFAKVGVKWIVDSYVTRD